VVNFGSTSEAEDIVVEWKQRLVAQEGDEEEISNIRNKNKLIIVTPQTASLLFERNLLTPKSSECFSLVVDKIDMHQAFDVDQELIDLA
jgi:hypothetical protein